MSMPIGLTVMFLFGLENLPDILSGKICASEVNGDMEAEEGA